ncbi:Kv channel-interacting protein 1 isoform X1 [Diachasmimorpha longicaudata]|uniref:Kv channel-interacting protein 1 isoform X1 n=1 Tax=Diachasmimorpha longicaudata TaxID=58733 RepID=UPI0030B8EFE1
MFSNQAPGTHPMFHSLHEYFDAARTPVITSDSNICSDIEKLISSFIGSKDQLNISSLLSKSIGQLCHFSEIIICFLPIGFDDALGNCECPEGVVQEDSFKDIYAKFFPHGNSSLYAHYVFKAFDVNCNGAISFRDLLVTLSTLLRGSIYEKLRWTFKLYDINGDGCITRGELGEVVTAVHELMGRKHPAEEERKAREQLDRVFEKLDLNHDGVITIEEFIESCLKDEVITRSLAMFDCEL